MPFKNRVRLPWLLHCSFAFVPLIAFPVTYSFRMPAGVHLDEVRPERSISKLSRALSKLNLRADAHDTRPLWKDQVKAFEPFYPDARNILSHVPIPPGLSKSRVREYIHSTSITPNGKAFHPQCSEIIPNRIFVSDRFTGTDATLLQRLHITHVVCIANVKTQDSPPSPSLHYHELVVPNDAHKAGGLVAKIDDTVDFIDGALKMDDSRVLVHCIMGIHWSPSIVIAWLMRNGKCSYVEAQDTVRRKREVVHPGRDLEVGIKEWWALELARPSFPPGRGGRCQPFVSCLDMPCLDIKMRVMHGQRSCELEGEDEVIDIRRYS